MNGRESRDSQIRRSVVAFVVLTMAWLATGIALMPGMAYGYTVARLSIWWDSSSC